MFAGVGGEWLYRPFESRLAFGIDVNEVRQRGFRQDFELRDYRVATGHATLYWDTGWNNVLANVSFGRYLAGDIGSTLQLERVFDNGVSIGGYFTKTNVSAQQFGEGSFDKGLFLKIPFDAMLTRSSTSVANIFWQPLIRDGGAKLAREVRLYDETRVRGNRTLDFHPAPPPNDQVIPVDRRERYKAQAKVPEPFTSVLARPAGNQWSPDFEMRLVEALYGQGFRDIAVKFDSSRRLNVEATNDQMRPISRAVGRAARTALGFAPIDTREIRVVFSEQSHPIVTYDFIDIGRLQDFFRGAASREQLRSTVSVEYRDPAMAQGDPLAPLDDLSTETDQGISRLLPSVNPVRRAFSDMAQAGQTAGDIDWLKAGMLGAGIVLASSLVDNRAFRFANEHPDNKWLKKTTQVGNAIPIAALGVGGLAALVSSDPELSRSGYSAVEAGGAAYLVATALKYAAGRSRPGEGVSNHSFSPFSTGTGKDAFPSRHTIVAAAAIAPFARTYDAPWLYGLVGITAAGRVASRQHWVSDTVAGGFIGAVIGEVFYQSSRTPRRGEPRVLLGPNSVALAWQFQ